MRLISVSNRLPVVLQSKEGGWEIKPAPGGLVTALGPILRSRGGVWIGWPGVTDSDSAGIERALQEHGRQVGYGLVPVLLSAGELDAFYNGFCNEIIWPLFHDLQSQCNFVPEYWASYQAVMQKFAEAIVSTIRADDFLWVHDYHLMNLGHVLRERGIASPMGFFLHIPFPPPDIFAKLPWRQEVLEALLWYTLIGLQTVRDRDNFLDCVRKLVPGIRIRRRGRLHAIEGEGRTALVGVFPIGIDYDEFAEQAAKAETAEHVRSVRGGMADRQIVLGIDRLDYTKGIPYRLKAFRLALQRYPELRRRVALLQVVVPSREAVGQYQDLKAEIERLVAQINGEFTEPGWVPIHYVFRSIDRSEMVTFYRAADVGFVTPLKDGMNLVAKEYCACQTENDGVLILSEFAGAAEQLGRTILVNPYDLERVAEALCRAVNMSHEQRRPVMRRLRRIVRRQNVHWWADRFLKACGAGPSTTIAAEDSYACTS